MPVAQSLSVHPPSLIEREGDPEVNFFCREDDKAPAINIVWVDPQENTYIPGSTSEGGNARISATGNGLSISNIHRNDTGTYRCIRNSSNYTEFANGNLSVFGMYILHTFISCFSVFCTLFLLIYSSYPLTSNCTRNLNSVYSRLKLSKLANPVTEESHCDPVSQKHTIHPRCDGGHMHS